MAAKKTVNFLFKTIITLILTAMGGWLFYFNWLQRPIHYRNYTFSIEESQRLRSFARAQYAHGLHAWFQNDPETAAAFFKQTVLQDVFFLDAWFRLAEAEATMGHRQKAEDILAYTANLTDGVLRWKWPQTLLACDLGMDDIVYRNTNFLLTRRLLTQDSLQLLHMQSDGDVTETLNILEPGNLTLYLNWLMRWGMTEDTLSVWHKIRENGKPDAEIGLQYANFLLNQKHIAESIAIWQEYSRLDGVTNGGFEKEITQCGFDWRYWNDEGGSWKIERVNKEAHKGKHALRISFAGFQNISFHSFYQIFPVIPLERFRLNYAWKSDGISTDQGPFVEIIGYDQAGLSECGLKITGTNKWRTESIEFQPPEGCRAALVRVRRLPSHRFDSKIKGSLWLDDFRLEILKSDKKQVKF